MKILIISSLLLFLNCGWPFYRTKTIDCYMDPETCARTEMIRNNYVDYEVISYENSKLIAKFYNFKLNKKELQ